MTTRERLLRVNEKVRQIMERAIAVEDKHAANHHGGIEAELPCPDDCPRHWLGWEWHDVQAQPATLRMMVAEGLLRVSYNSRSTTCYRVDGRLDIKQTLSGNAPRDDAAGVPPDLFDHIIGYGQAKRWIMKSLTGQQPVHILLEGPPGTAKSLLLEAIAELPGSYYALGSTSTKAGIAEFLMQFRPRILVIDEIEKMSMQDFAVLLSLMQSGMVRRLTKTTRDEAEMTTWVFAGANRTDRLPPELLSRFHKLDFSVYSPQEFEQIVAGLVERDLGKPRALGEYVARVVGRRTRDVRQALHVARLCDTAAEVDELEGDNLTTT